MASVNDFDVRCFISYFDVICWVANSGNPTYGYYGYYGYGTSVNDFDVRFLLVILT
jgi:hypothetical protein